MKQLIIALFAFVFISYSCNKTAAPTTAKKESDGCYVGKLVKKGICGQYVIELQSVDAQGLEIAATWHDPSTSITHQNVFTVANACDFPATIKQGETINFTIAAASENTCPQCKAYTPTPAAKNYITVGCTTN